MKPGDIVYLDSLRTSHSFLQARLESQIDNDFLKYAPIINSFSRGNLTFLAISKDLHIHHLAAFPTTQSRQIQKPPLIDCCMLQFWT